MWEFVNGHRKKWKMKAIFGTQCWLLIFLITFVLIYVIKILNRPESSRDTTVPHNGELADNQITQLFWQYANAPPGSSYIRSETAICQKKHPEPRTATRTQSADTTAGLRRSILASPDTQSEHGRAEVTVPGLLLPPPPAVGREQDGQTADGAVGQIVVVVRAPRQKRRVRREPDPVAAHLEETHLQPGVPPVQTQ